MVRRRGGARAPTAALNPIRSPKSPLGIIYAIMWLVLAIAILVIFIWAAIKVPIVEVNPVLNPIPDNAWKIMKYPGFILGVSALPSPPTYENFIMYLLVFIILFVAISDLLTAFSTFSTGVNWIIGFAFASLIGVVGASGAAIRYLAGTARIGALGIGLIILGSILAAVTLNIGLGGWARRWRLNRQVEVESMKTARGVGRVTSAIQGLKEVVNAFTQSERI